MINIVNELERINKELHNEYEATTSIEQKKVQFDFNSNEFLEFLNETKKKSRAYTIPISMSIYDVDINKLIENYLLLTKEKRIEIRISEEVGWLLLGFGFSMATYSLRLNDQKYFTHGLIAMNIAYKAIDWREILRVLAAYWDVHKRKRLSFQTAIEQSDNDFSMVLQQFITRRKSSKSLKSMGLELVGEGQNIQYKYKNS